jgi:mannonate dehydratase
MKHTWRWFGPNDRITFDQIRQAGANGIVSALHQIPVGELWTTDEIQKRKKIIEDSGLVWSVVESVPVSEDIKKRIGNFRQHIENYKQTIRNLASCGIKTICYNFMPILDWSRTNLTYKFPDGSESLRFELAYFVAFDIHILKREGAANSYPAQVVKQANEYFTSLNDEQRDLLKETILLGLPGSLEAFTLDELKQKLKTYEHIDTSRLKENLFAFIREIVPVAEESDVKLAIHPDDPPWSLMGLPRIVSTEKDLEEIINVIDSPSNGITLCTGSLGAGYFNDLPRIANKFSKKINFAHLRNVIRDESLNFNESYLFEGDVDIYEVMKSIILEENRRKSDGEEHWQIPMRPDHGNQMLDDIGKDNYPGYSLYGRMKNLAELKGLEIGICRSLGIDFN